MGRILKLASLDLDYSDINDSLKDLARLAAKVAGTSISRVNLVDAFTQWTVSDFGLPPEQESPDQIAREDSVCQYTIVSKECLEVKDLSEDDRFRDKSYVAGDPWMRYYFGVPLETSEGFNLGALCVLDRVGKEITPEKVELLKIIAREIVSRLTTYQVIQRLKSRVKDAADSQRRVAHDIRGPLGGIISLAELIHDQGDHNKMDEVLEFIGLIQKSGNSLLELADEILSVEEPETPAEQPPSAPYAINTSCELNLLLFQEKLRKLYSPQAVSKGIVFSVTTGANGERTPFSKNKLMQIAGNLISNAMKFTPAGGSVSVQLHLAAREKENILQIQVRDTGVGLTAEEIHAISHGRASSTEGTEGEAGYGFGLALVKHLVEGLRGSINISSTPGEGALFEVSLPLRK
jgi:signal transduction histidine kinase